MKERGRCGRRNCEKVETEEERLGGSPHRDSSWTRCREQWISRISGKEGEGAL